MARPKRAPEHVEPEDESQDVEALEATEPDEEPEEGEPETGAAPTMSKADAIRAALAAGADTPDAGVRFIKDRFGLDVTKQHWSASSSQFRKKDGSAPKAPRAPRAAKAPAPSPRAETPAPTKTAASADVIGDLEAVKALIRKHGVDGLKRLADLFDD